MAISVVQRNIAGNAAVASSPTLAYGSNVTAGSALIAVTAIDSGSGYGIPTDTLKNTYISLPRSGSTADGMFIYAAIAYNTPSGANTITFTTGFNDSAIALFEVSGLAANNAFDQSNFQEQISATALSSGNITTRWANELLIGVTINSNSTALNPTVGAGYGNLQTSGVVFGSTATEEQITSSIFTGDAEFTLAANSDIIITAIYSFSDTSSGGGPYNSNNYQFVRVQDNGNGVLSVGEKIR